MHPRAFSSNFKMAFKKPLDEITFEHVFFYNVKLRVEFDVSLQDNQPSIFYSEINDFKFLTCALFSFMFNININECVCYPTSYNDWIAINTGLSKNCYSIECKQRLMNNPTLFDPLVHFDCSDNKASNFVFSFLNIFSSGNLTIQIHNSQKNL